MTKEVGFFVAESMMVQSRDAEMVKKIQEYVDQRSYEYLKMPGNNGEITYARIDCIPAFTFRELSDLIGTDGRHLTLAPKNDSGTAETPTT